MKVYSRLNKKLALAAAAFCVSFILTTCQTLNTILQEPRISLHSVEMAKIDFTGADLLCKIQVENPNAFNIPFPEVDWQFFINANSFISGVVKNNQRISARNTTLVNVPVRLNYTDVFNSFKSLLGNRQTAYRIALDTKFSIPVIGDKIWHFEHGGELPLIQLPKLSAPSMKIDNVDFTKAELLVTLNVENPNAFSLPPVKIAYEYLVNRNSFIKGSTDSPRQLAASSATPLSFRFSVNYSDLYRSFQSLLSSSEVPSSLVLTADFGIPAFRNEPFRLDISGTLPLLKF